MSINDHYNIDESLSCSKNTHTLAHIESASSVKFTEMVDLRISVILFMQIIIMDHVLLLGLETWNYSLNYDSQLPINSGTNSLHLDHQLEPLLM